MKCGVIFLSILIMPMLLVGAPVRAQQKQSFARKLYNASTWKVTAIAGGVATGLTTAAASAVYFARRNMVSQHINRWMPDASAATKINGIHEMMQINGGPIDHAPGINSSTYHRLSSAESALIYPIAVSAIVLGASLIYGLHKYRMAKKQDKKLVKPAVRKA